MQIEYQRFDLQAPGLSRPGRGHLFHQGDFIELGEEAALAGEIAAEQHVVMAAHGTGFRPVRDRNLDIRGASGGGGHGMRLHHATHYVQRDVARVIVDHGHGVAGIPEDLDGATAFVGVGEPAQQIGPRLGVQAIQACGARAVRGVIMIPLGF